MEIFSTCINILILMFNNSIVIKNEHIKGVATNKTNKSYH